MWNRPRLVGQNQHTARTEIGVPLIQAALIAGSEFVKNRGEVRRYLDHTFLNVADPVISGARVVRISGYEEHVSGVIRCWAVA